MKNNRIVKIIVLLIILVLSIIIGLTLTKKEKETEVDDFKHRESHYYIEDFDYTKLKDRTYISKIFTTEKEYNEFLEENSLNENEGLKPLKKDFENENYIILITTIDSCSETVTYNKYKLKDDKLVLKFNVEQSCGLCAAEYYVYEIAISKKIDKDIASEVDYNITSESHCDPDIAYKPLLYLYPEETTAITVNFQNEENLTTTYPKFNEEWQVIASPNGDLYDKNNNYYYGLYWEEKTYNHIDFKEGFYVSKDNAIPFLEEKLSIIGLNAKERNEFIMYWLPILEKNEHNLVYFELTEELQKDNKLLISPQPDTLIRIRIHVKQIAKKENIKEQKLTSYERKGFVAVEWGGVIH